MSNRKPHSDFAGYIAERRNTYSGGHTVLLDCKLAEKQGNALVADYIEEGGRYQILCDQHGHIVYSPNLPAARECVEDPTIFCMVCRCIAGEAGDDWERSSGLTSEEISAVWSRRKPFKPLRGDPLCKACRGTGKDLGSDNPIRDGEPVAKCHTCAGTREPRHLRILHP